MTLSWFLPLAVIIGLAVTHTTFRHVVKVHARDRSWWLLLVISWFPLVCWIISQKVIQD